MPIILDDLSQNTQLQTIYIPTFFSDKLTGRGKTTGLLSLNNSPLMIPPDETTSSALVNCTKRTNKSGMTTVNTIPLNPLYAENWQYMENLTITDEEYGKLLKIGTNRATKKNLYLRMALNSIGIEEITDPNGKGIGIASSTKKIHSTYMIQYFYEYDSNSKCYQQLPGVNLLANHTQSITKNMYSYVFSGNPLVDIQKQCTTLQSEFDIDAKTVLDFISDYNIYDAACEQSEIWQTNIHEIMDQLFQNIESKYTDSKGIMFTQPSVYMMHQIRYIMNYNIPLELYKHIYQSIKKHFKDFDASSLCKENLNLLLSSTMDALEQGKSQITSFQPMDPKKPLPTSVQNLSPQQKNACLATEPLVIVQSGAGSGKALPLDTPILTPKGWTTMGELHVGDTITGSDGKPCKILKIHEQGLKSGYELTFRDRSSVKACGEHLWTINTANGDKIRKKTITTEEWIHNRKYYDYAFLPTVKPVEYEYGEKELPIDPYLMGALLADGCLANNSIQYTKSEKSVYEYVAEIARKNGYEMYNATCENSTAKQWRFKHPDDHTGYSRLKSTIRELGLLVKSHDKFIPKEYKTASISQRKELLNGLFDSDGDIRNNREYAKFNTVSDQMAEDVLQLLWSLGLSARKTQKHHKKGDYWSVNLYDSEWNPFLKSEYAAKYKGSKKHIRRSLIDAKPIDPVPMRCIEVDAPDKLYVTKDFIVTHNSTTIKARIDYMCASGIDPKDIMVLSFTNAAADHIKELNPKLHSMTIASMIHELYSTNFTTHELSSLDTIINSIDIYYGNLPPIVNGKEPIQRKFKNVLYKLKKNEPNAYTEVNNFIERNYDAVIDTLDTIKQTSLELEIIICYQKIDTLNEPDTITSKYLIMDEVQDNSVFEFVYILKYVEKHKEPLFLVGDSAQTLYEFRSSNPKAINILEGSGTFKNYKLTVNYRSNQEILNFANVLLQNIEANQYANIQLQANSLATVTEQSFLDRVNFNYHRLQKLSDLKDALPVIMGTEVKPYLDKCIARKEQIAFLAYTKNEIAQIENLLRTLYPNKEIVNMIPTKPFNSTIMSEFIKRYWNELKFAPATNMIQIIEDEIMRKLPYLVYNTQKAEKNARDMLASWKQQNKGIIAAWTNQVNAGQITQDIFMDLLKENMLNYEITNNAILQAKISQKNARQKETEKIQNADFLLSTIHSAKGLEFDNVVVLHKNRNNMNEADKRMYYVAFTRAMNTEYILSYDTVASPQIEADYHTILQTLHAKAPAPNSPLNNQPHPKEKRKK